jgi:hypothetical protein
MSLRTHVLIIQLNSLMEEAVMIKGMLEKNIVGILGVSLTATAGLLAYQLMTYLFIQAVINSLSSMPH